MKFTAWQIDKLIRGLDSYRVMKAANARLLPWKSVLDHLLMSKATASAYPADGGEPDFKEEALRRFAGGRSTLQVDKLEDVRRFLVEAKVLDETSLLEDANGLKEALIVHSFLADESEAGGHFLAGLAKGYRSTRTGTFETEQVELRFVAQPSANLVSVEERLIAAPTAVPQWMTKDLKNIESSTRKGYGFTSSTHGTFHVFVRGSSRGDLIHYVTVTSAGGSVIPNGAAPLLVRSGPPLYVAEGDPFALVLDHVEQTSGETGLSRMDTDSDKALDSYNILRFAPIEPVSRPSPVHTPTAPTTRDALELVPDTATDTTALDRQLAVYVRDRAIAAVRDVVKHGADVNLQDAEGMTPLHHAASRGMRPIVRILVGCGRCDYLIRDNQGRYAFELAIEWARDYAVGRLLAKKQAQQAAARGVPAYEPRA